MTKHATLPMKQASPFWIQGKWPILPGEPWLLTRVKKGFFAN